MRPPLPSFDPNDGLRVLVVCDNASLACGGESTLPLHYLRLMRERGCAVWLVTHARCREELQSLFPDDDRITFIEDAWLHRALWRLGLHLPVRLAYDTTGLLSRMAVQLAQRRVVRRLVAECAIDLIHQPVPVSPLEPSLMTGLGAPVVIGPMNGGMNYPPAFRGPGLMPAQLLLHVGRACAQLANTVLRGKREAALLLVANARTRKALPLALRPRIVECPENGVELRLWQGADARRAGAGPVPLSAPTVQPAAALPCFAFVGRLLPLKAVDVLIAAFAIAVRAMPMRLLVIGDGPARMALERQATAAVPPSAVRFTGWLSQADCADELAQADCMVMPSLHDCGGAVVLEAMAMAKPVIATAWGGPLDYLDASCGILVEPSSRTALIQGMARAMVWLAAAPQERAALGRAGRAKVEAHYDWNLRADVMLQHYRRVVREAEQAAVDADADAAPFDGAQPQMTAMR